MKLLLLLLFIFGSLDSKLYHVINEARHQKVAFDVPSTVLFDAVKQAFAEISAVDSPCDHALMHRLNKLLKPLGMRFVKVKDNNEEFYVLKERKGMYYGRGIYVVRCAKNARPICIQAPHSFFDQKTLPIAFELFKQTRARFFMTNTIHRYKGRLGEVPGSDMEHPADCAHNKRLLFQAVTEGIFTGSPATLFVQIHGFKKKVDDAFDVIVSTGNKKDFYLAARFAKLLKQLPFKIGVYGRDAHRLGALSNVQGRFINLHKGNFLHIENSAETRMEFLNQPRLLQVLTRALIELINEP